MVVKPDWQIFESNFSENPELNFEWMCYQLFCREFGKDKGIFRYYNQPSLETEPITHNNDVIGFQAKYYTVNLTERKSKIKNVIKETKKRYPNLTILYFYSNQDWTAVQTALVDKKTEAQKDLEKEATANGIKIEWRTKSFFESEFVTIENSNITQYFFDNYTNEYYKKIKTLDFVDVKLLDDKIFQTALYIENQEKPLTGRNILSKYIIDELNSKDIQNFSNIFIKGVPGIGKSTEMKIAYNELLKKCSSENCYKEFQFLPTPYFFELKNYQNGCFDINEKENTLLFLDGIDEISNQDLISFIKELKNLKSKNPSIRFVISGRDGAFITEMQAITHKNIRLSFYIDSDLQNLIYKFKGTVFEPFIGIPFYRNFLINQNYKDIKTYHDFIKTLIFYRLEDDKLKHDRSENLISSISNGINLEDLQKKLAGFSNSLFKLNRKTFSTDDLKHYFNETELWFILKSSLLDFKDENNISFYSNIYYEYFLALYYSTQSKTIIEKNFFLPTGRVIVQYVNIIAILMNIIPNKTKIYDKLSKKLKNETCAYILLTDYILLPSNERYTFYKEILKEFNTSKNIIYYTRFTKSNNLLKNIDSLSDSMHKLLPEEFYEEAVKLHCDTIKNFLRNPTIEDITTFENAVILLGVHDKFWKEKQYSLLKEVAVPLIRFFRENEIAMKMKGLLSEDIILSWYEDYNWVNTWEEKEWTKFVKEITNIDNTEFLNFKDENDFRIKLKLFNHFHSNSYIRKLLVPLTIRILQNKNYTSDEASFVPNSLDDDFETPTIHFDNDISYFSYTIKNYEIPISDLLYILNSIDCNYVHHNYAYQLEELYRDLLKSFKENISKIQDDEIPELYTLFKKYINTDDGIFISDFNSYIKLLNDNHKELLFDLLLSDLIKNTNWQNLWMLHNSIVILLDIKNKDKAISLCEKLKEMKRVYGECVADIYIPNLKEHPLYDLSKKEYPLLFPQTVRKEEEHKKNLSQFESLKKKMLEKEIDIIANKDNLLCEVNNIIEYLDKTKDCSERDTDRGRLLDLQVDYIGNKLQYAYKEEYKIPKIFSSFALTYLFNFTNDDQSLNRPKAIKNIEEWFADDKYFWRYFFWLYICHYKKEETDEFLNKNPKLIERIKESLQKEVSYFSAGNGLSLYDGGRNRFWVVPFVHYLSRFYNNKLPEWFDKSKILNFIAYPAWQLSTGYGVHINGEFKWESWNSVFDWIRIVSDIDEDMIIEKSLSILPELKSDQSITQIVTVFVEKIKTNEKYKQQMLDVIIEKTIEELQKDFKDHNEKSIMNGGVLSSFWRETQEDLIDKLYPYVDFSKYNTDDINYCRRSVFEYICKNANENERSKIIESLKNRISEKTIRIYLSKMGYDKAIILTINDFLKGENFNTNYVFYSPLFGKAPSSLRLLYKYFQLYKYSLAKKSDRRDYLIGYAKEGILQTTTKNNFWFIKRNFNKLIKKYKKDGKYFEGVEDFLNEIEQRIFSDEND